MTRVNTDVLGISELKWTAVGEFSSDDHYLYYYGQKSLGRNGVVLIVNKRVRNAVLGCNLKNDRMISVRFQGKQHRSNPILCPQLLIPKKLKLTYEDLQNLPELTPKKDVLFIIGDCNAKVGSQDTSGITCKLTLKYKMKQGKG